MALGSIALASGGAVSALIAKWPLGLTTQSEVDKVKSEADALGIRLLALEQRLSASEADVVARLKLLEQERTRLSELTGQLVGELAGDEVALHTALRMLAKPPQREAITRRRVDAINMYEVRVVKSPVLDARARVLKDNGVTW